MKRQRIFELVLVLTILFLLFLGVVSTRFGSPHRPYVAKTLADINALSVAMNNYEVDCNVLPTAIQGLKALLINPGVAGWRGPYLNRPILTDAWGTPYRYTTTTNGFEIRSAGPDKTFGNADDLTNWQMNHL